MGDRDRSLEREREKARPVAAYLRVSSREQTNENQGEAVARAARARGHETLRWYMDQMTGATLKRPELARLRADIRAGVVSTLYVYKLDRLTRSGIRDTLDLVEEFTRNGCKLVTIADGFDLTGPAGEIVLAVLAWAAKVERLAIGERISAARSRVEGKGGTWGRPPRMRPEQLTRARSLAAKGASVRSIAVALKVPHSTVHRALSRKPAEKRAGRSAAKQARPGP